MTIGMKWGSLSADGGPHSRLRTLLRDCARSWVVRYAALLLVVSVLVYLPVLRDVGARVFATNDDSSLFIWWLAHAAAVVRGWFTGGTDSSLLFSTMMNHPDGVNGAWNTSVLGLALPMVPVTLLAGPVVSYNLLIVASPVASALAAACAARRWASVPAACLAGLVYGFSSYIVAQSGGHLNLSFAILPPIVAGAVYDLVATDSRLRGIVLRLGVAVGFQMYLSTEVLASTALMTLLGLLVLASVRWGQVPAIARRLLLGSVGSVLIALVVGLPLLVMLIAGGSRPAAAIRPHGIWDNDFFDLVLPVPTTALNPFPGWDYGRSGYIDDAERGLYLGVPLLVLALIAVVLRRRANVPAVVVPIALTGAIAWLLSLGSVLYFAGNPVEGLVLPWRMFELVPVIANVLPMRLALFVTLAAAILAAVSFDILRAHRRWSGYLAGAIALIFVFPAPVPARAVSIPQFFTNGSVSEVIGAGDVVKTVPRARALAEPHADEAMVWQAVAGMRYADTGGYFIGSALGYSVIYQALDDPYDAAVDAANQSGSFYAPDSAQGRAAAESLRSQGIDFVLIADNPWLPVGAAETAAWTGSVLDSPARLVDGVWVVPVG
ncbi:hypothetical protein LWF01_08440 [Saxibacter everestensis]|uniref:Glycosyltransferase RgtA/B/C/D-like domain-containing protein n=1 Tax=Saxibacter everestensis TaxID=2909229 RepID=A0ABY8QXL6_9MICO|nr:hypothetical protein LWF01_08440 [Brevibacteriaceae bacterium ZFBP1038]